MSGCPDDATLLAQLAGERSRAASASRTHVVDCERCQAALAGFDAAREALAPAEPSLFQSARMARELDRALDGDFRVQRHAWRVPRVVAAVAVAALSGAAFATVAMRGVWAESTPAPVASAPAIVQRPALPTPVSPPARVEQPPATAFVSPAPAAKPRARVRPAPTALELAETDWARVDENTPTAELIVLGDRFAAAGATDRAATAYVEALGRAGEGASAGLARLVRGGGLTGDEALVRLAASDAVGATMEGQRLKCEWGLKYRSDRQAVADCQAFGRAHPSHPAVRVLALAAGKAAESRLGDLELAVAEYSRALLVSEYAGVSGTHALLARARARAKLGETAEAEADLRLYLHVAPEAWNRHEIQALAAELGVTRKP